MNKAFIYWDNSNVFIGAREVAAQREGEAARIRVRIHFRNLLDLARAGRQVEKALAVGSVPPELRHVWNSMENEGIEVRLLERGSLSGGEQGVDQLLQTEMLRDGFDFNGDPGIAVLLTGDGRGFSEGAGFHARPGTYARPRMADRGIVLASQLCPPDAGMGHGKGRLHRS